MSRAVGLLAWPGCRKLRWRLQQPIEIPGELGSHSRTIVDDNESSVVGHQLFAFAAASVADSAGGAFDALHRDLLGEPFGAVPAAEDAPGRDAHRC